MNPTTTTFATCPSLEQLMGVIDPTDPCQNGTAASTGINTPGVGLSSISPWLIVGIVGIVVLASAMHSGR
jgi:hypothetical protein